MALPNEIKVPQAVIFDPENKKKKKKKEKIDQTGTQASILYLQCLHVTIHCQQVPRDTGTSG